MPVFASGLFSFPAGHICVNKQNRHKQNRHSHSRLLYVTLCDTDTVLPHSQGHAIIIAASDSIMIQFYLLHRGQELPEAFTRESISPGRLTGKSTLQVDGMDGLTGSLFCQTLEQ
ncbi:unnamed protein product [Pleuronectes platessa]|uniref:Uncharacterized protein n=1 Tax=Pleuronectes platessa TaxID=8262 RepID=A0A9N7ZBU9_PLEPL|nr:unnamed protein product [Pleuronectes platessa]